MGKVKKLRQKYHVSLKKSKSLSSFPEIVEERKEDFNSKKNFFKSNENIFAGIKISYDELNKSLPKDFDSRSVLSTKSRKELKEEERHLKKKEKQKLRHERFLQKLEFDYHALQAAKLKKKKQKKPYNNMSSLLDALPSLESIAVEASKKKFEKSKAKKPKGTLKAKHRLKQQSFDSLVFRQIMDNKKFKMNPFETISEYLQQKLASEK